MIDPPLPPDPLVQYWLDRHRTKTSFVLHMIGIPPTILGVLFIPIYLTLFSLPIFYVALALFVGGYILQFAGHALEGTDPGEIIYFKRPRAPERTIGSALRHLIFRVQASITAVDGHPSTKRERVCVPGDQLTLTHSLANRAGKRGNPKSAR
jgi:hypothetical protein